MILEAVDHVNKGRETRIDMPGQPGNGFGGAKPGAGRPPGSIGNRAQAAARWLSDFTAREPDFNPLVELLDCYRDARRDDDLQVAAAILGKLADFLIPRMKPISADVSEEAQAALVRAVILKGVKEGWDHLPGLDGAGEALRRWLEGELAGYRSDRVAAAAEEARSAERERQTPAIGSTADWLRETSEGHAGDGSSANGTGQPTDAAEQSSPEEPQPPQALPQADEEPGPQEPAQPLPRPPDRARWVDPPPRPQQLSPPSQTDPDYNPYL